MTARIAWLAFTCFGLSVALAKAESPAEIEAWWTDMGRADGARAYQAMVQLAGAAEVTTFLGERLRPVIAVPRARMLKLVAELGNDKFTVRDQAYRQLEDLRDLAEDELAKALVAGPELESLRRIEQLLEKRDLLKSPARLQMLRGIEVLENLGNEEAKRVLQKLAAGAAEARQTKEAKASLERLKKR